VLYSSDASFASVVANDSGTMRFSAATIDVSADEPQEIKTIGSVNLHTNKEFMVDLSGNSSIPDIQLFITEEGEIVGEVIDGGEEIIY
jgi:hypothetical protein